jgi:hypothetical protein
MSRAILQSLLPCIAALAIAFAVLVLLVKLSGARFRWRRLRELHRCDAGGVQSLAFVLTVPFFILVVMFIVQVSQLMIGLIVVQYAAFAGARTASVWIPALVGDECDRCGGDEVQNRLDWRLQPLASDAAERLTIVPGDPSLVGQWNGSEISDKFRRIRTAAVLGVAPVGPSRDISFSSFAMSSGSGQALAATQRLYREVIPSSAGNQRIDVRLANKIAYADRNTLVWVEWRDARSSPSAGQTDSIASPTYNPVDHPYAVADYEQYGYKENEVGWQDPVTVYVIHRLALLPGPGRLVKDLLIRPIGVPARIRQRIPAEWSNTPIAETNTYAAIIPAAATITNEGLKSDRPYAHPETR